MSESAGAAASAEAAASAAETAAATMETASAAEAAAASSAEASAMSAEEDKRRTAAVMPAAENQSENNYQQHNRADRAERIPVVRCILLRGYRNVILIQRLQPVFDVDLVNQGAEKSSFRKSGVAY